MNTSYRQPTALKFAAWIFIALTSIIFIVLLNAWIQETTTDRSALIGIPTLFMPFYIGAWWILWMFRGKLVLSNHNISHEWMGIQRTLEFSEITGFIERGSQLIPYLELKSPSGNLRIYHATENFRELYQRVTASIQFKKHEELPLNLSIPASYKLQTFIYTGIYLAFTGALSFGATFTQGQVKLFSGILIWGLFIAILLFTVIISEWKQPQSLNIQSNKITVRYLFGREHSFDTHQIRQIEQETQVRRLRYGGRMVLHPLVITFSDGERLVIEESRVWTFGYAPIRLTTQLINTFIKQ